MKLGRSAARFMIANDRRLEKMDAKQEEHIETKA
jgi:hypothetical protein